MSPQIETLLRDSLTSAAEGVPESSDPWPGFARQERHHRRSRRIRRTAVAAAIAAVVGFQSGLVPLPGWAPGIAIASRPDLLADSPTRGNLAGDTAWLAGLRQEIKDVQDPGELWKVGDRSKIKFLYAADFAGRRLSLALVPLRFGFVTDWSLIWYEGDAGAAPAAMEEGGRSDGASTIETTMSTRSDGPGYAVVVAPAGSTVSLSRGFAYTPEGRVAHGDPVTFAPGSGVAELELPPTPISEGVTATVVQNGRTLYQGGLSGGWSGTGSLQEAGDQMVDDALRGQTFDRETLRRWINSALMDARLPAEGTTVTLRWTGTVNNAPAALFTLQRKDTGVLAYAMHGGPDSFRQDLRMLLPAADAESRTLAWRMRAEGKDDRTDQLNVVAPQGSAYVTLTVPGAAPGSVRLDAAGFGTTTLAPDAPASVAATTEDGRRLLATPVLPFETDSGGLPGDTTKTRIVE